MRRLTHDDILDVLTYQNVRPKYRARVLAHKHDRRIGVGDRVTLLFEDRETVRYQILEMARVEGARSEAQLQVELDVYNELVPGPSELSATLFIEIPELESIRLELDRLIGIDECVRFVLGEGDDEEPVTGDFDKRQLKQDRISAVHYLRFRFTEAQVERFANGCPVRLGVTHSAYRHDVAIPEIMRASLLRDLRGEDTTLLDAEVFQMAARPSEGAASDEILNETETTRVYRPAHPLAPEHVIVEPKAAIPSLLEADAATLSELLAAVQEIASGIRQRKGRCRVWTDVDPAEAKFRWHIAAPRE